VRRVAVAYRRLHRCAFATLAQGERAVEYSEVRIIRLEPMQVASVRAISETPEHDAWEMMCAWAEPRGLLRDAGEHPVFGFDNPEPSPEQKEYGYEFWIRVEPDTEPEGEIEVKGFAGGLYAVATCRVRGEPFKNIPGTWMKLWEWLQSSNFELGSHQALERFQDPQASEEELVLDLYLPLKL
jgi:DNA gyrase inhibitor GyrI